jgi:uncharacterized membrane protein (UPF0127 family)
MKTWFPQHCLLLALMAGAGCNKTNPMSNADNLAAPTNAATAHVSIEDILPKQAQPKLPTIKLWVGAGELETEMALTSEQMMTGMMWRTNMPENTAMLFVSPRAGRASYWMKNCYVPLSIAYIDVEGVILEIYDMQPMKTNAVPSASLNVQFALETPHGWFQRHNVNTGAVVRTERGSLMETFLQR